MFYARETRPFAASQDFAGPVYRAGGKEISVSPSERSSVLKVREPDPRVTSQDISGFARW